MSAVEDDPDIPHEGVVWVLSVGGARVEYATRGEALAAAWSITPPGAKRPEPRKVVADRTKLIPSLEEQDRARGGLLPTGDVIEVRGGKHLIEVKIPTTEPVDLRMDGVYVRKMVAAHLNREARDRKMVLARDTLEIAVTGDHMIGRCWAEPMPVDYVSETLPPPPPPDPLAVADDTTKRIIDLMTDETKKADRMYRTLKKALKRGAVTPEELEAAMTRGGVVPSAKPEKV